MKVLVVTNLYPTTDRPFMSPFVKEQVESLRRNFPELTVDVHVVDAHRPKLEYLKEMVRLPAIVNKGRYDIVHAHFGLTLISMLFVRVPVVITFHGTDLLINPTKSLSRLLAPTALKVVVVSKKLKNILGYGEVIPCGIDVENFTLPPDQKNWPIPKKPGRIKVLFPSNPANKVKDYGLFHSVCQELENRGYEIEKVHLVNIERERVRYVYWACDIMLLTSFSEGSPTVIKEALAAKLPFVSVDVGDVKDWAGLVTYGIVVPDRSPILIADAVIKLLLKIHHRGLLDNTSCNEVMDLSLIAHRIKFVYDQMMETPL